MAAAALVDYTPVSEIPGVGASPQQLAMLRQRYRFAASYCAGKDVLEVACGAGTGLGALARRARRVVAGDYTERLLQVARRHYSQRVPLVRLDADALPFSRQSFDVAVLCEAIYYLPSVERFVDEVVRVLRPHGTLFICTVNCEWAEFNPSPLSTRYLSARELADLLGLHGFTTEVYGSFPTASRSTADALLGLTKRVAVALGLIPKTMNGKARLKRLLYGPLAPVPPEVDDDGLDGGEPLSRLPGTRPVPGFKVLYAVGRLAS